MIALLVCAVIAGQVPAPTVMILQAEPETGGALVSRMLAKYVAAKRLRGQIIFLQRMDEKSLRTVTDLQADWPSKLMIRQVQNGTRPVASVVTSDGTTFSYPVPEDLASRANERLVESVEQIGQRLDFRRIYAITGRSIIDRSSALDIVIGRLDDLKFLRNQWATLTEMEGANVPNCRSVGGQWREYGNAAVSGSYQMWIDANANLRRFALTESIAIQAGQPPKRIVSQWDVDVVVDGPVDAAMFTVIR